MMKKMKHEKHGFMFVINDAEFAAAVERGWTSFDDSDKPKKEEPKQEFTEKEDRDLLIAIAKDLGKKIDKRWSNDKIREELGL